MARICAVNKGNAFKWLLDHTGEYVCARYARKCSCGSAHGAEAWCSPAAPAPVRAANEAMLKWLRAPALPRPFVLELLDFVLGHSAAVFREIPAFEHALLVRVCMLLTTQLQNLLDPACDPALQARLRQIGGMTGNHSAAVSSMLLSERQVLVVEDGRLCLMRLHACRLAAPCE
jgi:hypothetical protein